jgi:hypothetical protein
MQVEKKSPINVPSPSPAARAEGGLSSPVTDRTRARDLVAIGLLSVVINGTVLLYIGLHNPDYLRDYHHNANPDALHFVLLGHNIWERAAFSRMNEPPYTPDMLRTPVYPVVAGALDLACGAWGIYVFQALCGTVLALGVYLLCRPLFGRRVALIAGLLLSADLMLAVLHFEAMSETLYDVLATLGLFLWLGELYRPSEERLRYRRLVLSGGLLGLAILTRPTGLYLPLVLGLAQAAMALWRRSGRLLWGGVLTAAVAYGVIAPWVVRNYLVFGVPRLSTADTSNLIYSAGAGAYSVEHGVSWVEAQEMIHREYHIASFNESNNPWRADRSVKQIDDEQRAVQMAVLKKYPRSLVKATALGIGKASVSHNVSSLAGMSGQEWRPPGGGDLRHGRLGAFLGKLGENPPFLAAAFAWEVGLAGLLILGSLAGLVRGWRVRPWRAALVCIVLVSGYYVATIGVVGLDAYYRHRTMLVPVACLLTGMALASPRRAGAEEPVQESNRRA